jgi:pimeloyl-ACP methyl ester carboxylesterase
MGGSIALLGAAERPDMVTGLVVIATSCVVGRAAAEFFSDRISMVESGAMEELATALKEDTATQVLTEVDLDTLTAGRLAAIGDGAGYANAARAMMALRERPLTGRLAEVSCHVDVVSTDGDLFCPPRAGQMIVDGVADAAYHQIDGAGHLVTVDRPVALSALLDRLTSDMVGKGGSGPESDRDVLDEGAK